MRKALVVGAGTAALLIAAAGAPASPAAPNPPSADATTTLAVYGDAPYGVSPADTSQTEATPAFIQSINEDPDVRLVMHVGDIHSGKQYCTKKYDTTIFSLWAHYRDPLVYTPGDNEWTDCHKVAEGGGAYNATSHQIDYVTDSKGKPIDYAKGNPIANLDLIRRTFFEDPGVTLGQNPRPVISQAQAFDPSHPSDSQYVENVMWEQSNVLFVTINLPGGSNNDNDIWYGTPTMSQAQQDEISQRTAADIRWLNAAFARAQADGMAGVVIGAQADMWDPEKGAAHQAAYEPIVSTIATETTNFGKPVLMFNGDSHVYQSGNPLSPSDPNYFIHPGYDVPNFHRVVVHGSTTPLEWLKLTVDPDANHPPTDTTFGPFSWEREIQP
jgi:hypothetical protein